MRLLKSSGIAGRSSACSRMLSTDLPETDLTRGIPYWSLRDTPIWLGVRPSFASFMTKASTSSGPYLNHAGARLLTGRREWDFPLRVIVVSQSPVAYPEVDLKRFPRFVPWSNVLSAWKNTITVSFGNGWVKEEIKRICLCQGGSLLPVS